MSLKDYEKKRNLDESGEPAAELKSSPKKRIFVVHEHHASHLHWDLRLEIDGALKSWAVPKEPPVSEDNPKRLAIQVEDHPLEYAKFRGTIPEGNYGAGKVEIWDSGTYELKNMEEKKIEMVFRGKKLKGSYVLVKTNYGAKPEKSWLFFRTRAP